MGTYLVYTGVLYVLFGGYDRESWRSASWQNAWNCGCNSRDRTKNTFLESPKQPESHMWFPRRPDDASLVMCSLKRQAEQASQASNLMSWGSNHWFLLGTPGNLQRCHPSPTSSKKEILQPCAVGDLRRSLGVESTSWLIFRSCTRSHKGVVFGPQVSGVAGHP